MKYVFNNSFIGSTKFQILQLQLEGGSNILKPQPEGRYNSPILWLQPKGGYNPIGSSAPNGRWIQPPSS
jgi:hypothetical protein